MGGLPTPPLLPQSCLHACVRRASTAAPTHRRRLRARRRRGRIRLVWLSPRVHVSHPVCAAAVACLLPPPCAVAAQVRRFLALGAPARLPHRRRISVAATRPRRGLTRRAAARRLGVAFVACVRHRLRHARHHRLVRRDRQVLGVVRGVALRRLRRCRACLLYTSPSPRDGLLSRMPSSA